MKNVVRSNQSRKEQIEKLQDRFEFQERLVMPKGARLPGIKQAVAKENEEENKIDDKIIQKMLLKCDRRTELGLLYDQIIKEIDERYVYMKEMKALGKNKDTIIMAEIKDRIEELKKVQKMIDEYDMNNS